MRQSGGSRIVASYVESFNPILNSLRAIPIWCMIAITWPRARTIARLFFFFQAEDGIRDLTVTGVQTCALPIYARVVGPRSPPRALARDGQVRPSAARLARVERPRVRGAARGLHRGPDQGSSKIGRASCRGRG